MTEEDKEDEETLQSYFQFVHTKLCQGDNGEIDFYITTFEEHVVYPYFVFINKSSELNNSDLKLKAQVYEPSKTNLIINSIYKPIQIF